MTENQQIPLKSPKIVDKPWGREVWYAHEQEYAGKILEVKKGFALSLQKHERKKETMYLLTGAVRYHFNGVDFDMTAGNCLTVNPGDIHRVPDQRATFPGHQRRTGVLLH